MSHNSNDVQKSARRHWPALMAMAFALAMVAVVVLVFAPWRERPEPTPGNPVADGKTPSTSSMTAPNSNDVNNTGSTSAPAPAGGTPANPS